MKNFKNTLYYKNFIEALNYEIASNLLKTRRKNKKRTIKLFLNEKMRECLS